MGVRGSGDEQIREGAAGFTAFADDGAAVAHWSADESRLARTSFTRR